MLKLYKKKSKFKYYKRNFNKDICLLECTKTVRKPYFSHVTYKKYLLWVYKTKENCPMNGTFPI